MRILADSNIVMPAVWALRIAGHDVVYAAERAADPGDQALLAEASMDGRVFITKDRDIGTLVHRDRQPHCGVLLIDDMGDADAETKLVLSTLLTHSERLLGRAFLRASQGGIRESQA